MEGFGEDLKQTPEEVQELIWKEFGRPEDNMKFDA